jgi:hypothetical protein
MSSVRQPQQQVSLRFIYRKVNADRDEKNTCKHHEESER